MEMHVDEGRTLLPPPLSLSHMNSVPLPCCPHTQAMKMHVDEGRTLLVAAAQSFSHIFPRPHTQAMEMHVDQGRTLLSLPSVRFRKTINTVDMLTGEEMAVNAQHYAVLVTDVNQDSMRAGHRWVVVVGDADELTVTGWWRVTGHRHEPGQHEGGT